MGFNDKHNNAGGSDPDFGAIFMSNSATKRECLRSGLFGLPASYIPFVEKVKAGTTLFLFEYEKKLLHGVFMATCDGGINIVPKAFALTGMKYPAQVKFVPVWECKPIPEKIFRHAIRENYFANNKFSFGLSENQVEKLLHLFNMNKLVPEVPRRHMSMKSERYPMGEVGKSVGRGMLGESVQDDPRDSARFNGFSADDILASKRRRSLELGVDYISGDVRDYLRSKDESRLAARNNNVGRPVGCGMLGESVQADHVLGDNNLPALMHNYPGDSACYDGFSADEVLVNKRRRSSELGVDYIDAREYLQSKDESRLAAHNNEDYIDNYNYAAKLPLDTASGYVGDYSAIRDYSRFSSHENKDYTDTHLRPYTTGGYCKIPSDKIRVHGDGRPSVSDPLMGEDLRKTDKRMIFSDDIPSLRGSNSLVENHLRSTSAMIHPFHLNSCAPQGNESSIPFHLNSCAPKGNESSIPYNSEAPGFLSFGIDNGSESMKSMRPQGEESSILYNSEVPCLNFRQSSSFGINNDSESMRERFSPSTNCRRNLVSRERQRMHAELKDSHRWNGIDDCFSNSVLYASNRDCMPFNETRNSDQLASESALYEAHNTIPSFKSSPAPLPSSDIGNSGRTHESYSSLFCDHKSYLDNNVHPMELQNYLSHEITLPKNNEMLNPYVDSVPLDHGYDIGCYSDSQNSNCGHPNRKSSVFSRLSLVQDVNKQGKGNNGQNEEYDFITSVDEVMEMVRQTKRKPKPSHHNNAESVRGKTQISNQRKKSDCLESALEHNKDESLRSKTEMGSPRKMRDCLENALEHSEDESLRNKSQISSSLKKKKRGDCFESSLEDLNMDSTTVTGGSPKTKADKAHFVDFKRRSMVRKHNDEIERNSNESKKSENLGFVQQKKRKLIRPNFNKSASFEDKEDLGASQNFQLPLPNGIRNHKDVNESCSTLVNQCGYDVKAEAEVQNVIDPKHSEGKDSSHAKEFICSKEGEKSKFQNVVSSASCNKESSYTKENPCMMDNVKSSSLEMECLRAICQEKANVGTLCSLNDRSECVDNKNHQKGLSSASFKEESSHAKEGSSLMHNKKPASLEMESLHAISHEKANFGTLVVLNDVSECADNKNHQKVFSSASCEEESSHTKEGSCMMGIVKSASLETPHAICPEKESIGTLPPLNDGSECLDDKNHLKFLSSASCKEESYHTEEGSCMMDSKKSASLEKESLNSICQENNADKFICADRGIDPDGEMPKDCGFFSIEAKDGCEYLGNSGSEKAPIETCHVEACI
ncbi:unnamed protein product [Lathyrus oleraceus]